MYLAIVLDLFSRRVVSWAMRDHADINLVLHVAFRNLAALAQAERSYSLGSGFVLHQPSLAEFPVCPRPGVQREPASNCHDNAPVESFFGLLKRERVRRRIYLTKEAARADVFDYNEMFYNPKRGNGPMGICRL